jgi:hypothetical protein
LADGSEVSAQRAWSKIPSIKLIRRLARWSCRRVSESAACAAPGQFGKVRFRNRPSQKRRPGSAARDPAVASTQTILTVGSDDKVRLKTITTSDRVGDAWVVEQG